MRSSFTKEESEILLSEEEFKGGSVLSSRQRQTRLPWTLAGLSTAVAAASIFLNIRMWTQQPTPCIFSTDIADGRSAIVYEKRTFTGGLSYDPESDRVLRFHDAPIEYFGPPSEELDAKWEDLLKWEFPVMAAEEAAPFEPELTRLRSDHQFHFEPDVFHSLHCLNAVRKEVSTSLYQNANASSHWHDDEDFAKEHPEFRPAHIEHCMDRIRQEIMCHGDLTPSPLYSWEGFNIALGKSGEHTCRKWEPIREWMNDRHRRNLEIAVQASPLQRTNEQS